MSNDLVRIQVGGESYLCRTAVREGKISFKEEMLRRAKNRGDEWGNDVAFRADSALYVQGLYVKVFQQQP